MELMNQSLHCGFDICSRRISSSQEVKPTKGKVLSEGSQKAQEKWQG